MATLTRKGRPRERWPNGLAWPKGLAFTLAHEPMWVKVGLYQVNRQTGIDSSVHKSCVNSFRWIIVFPQAELASAVKRLIGFYMYTSRVVYFLCVILQNYSGNILVNM